MKHPISLILASVLCAGFLAGCSNEVQTAHHGCCCPTDPIASFGQDIYYGRYTSCWSDGHQVPITFATRCDYSGESMTVANAPSPNVSVSTAPNPNVSVSGSGNPNVYVANPPNPNASVANPPNPNVSVQSPMAH